MLFLGSDAMDYLEILDICGFDSSKATELVDEILNESGLEDYVESLSAVPAYFASTASLTSQR